MTTQIPLSGQHGEGKFTMVDDEHFSAVSAYTWRFENGYATTNIAGSRKHLRLHRLIIGNPPRGLEVDHIDGNRLNNQRANLRFVTHTQNSQNRAPRQGTSSAFKGVHWNGQKMLWAAVIHADKVRIHLGFFASELDAARAYNVAAVERFGEYARLNVILDNTVEPVYYRQATPFARGGTSQYRGVCFRNDRKRWESRINVAGKTIRLGYFDSEKEAAKSYDIAAKRYHGDRAFLNFPATKEGEEC